MQSIYDITLKKINRAETAEDVLNTIKQTYDMGIKVCTHFIFGLPNESEEMMLETIRKTISMGVDSIKIHPLYIVKNTSLANEYKNGKFKPITQSQYLATLNKAIDIVGEHTIIQRVSAGIDDETLLAPSWCRDKNLQMKEIKISLRERGYEY